MRRRALVLDSGVLADWLIVRLCGDMGLRPPSSFEHHGVTEENVDDFEASLARHPSRVFATQAALAEVHGLAQRAEWSPTRTAPLEFWEPSLVRLRSHGVIDRGHEPTCRWEGPLERCVHRLGPADAGVIALAHELVTADGYECGLVVSDDQDLRDFSRVLSFKRVDAMSVHELLQTMRMEA